MSDGEIVRKLWSFVVPTDKPEFRTRVAVSMAFLVASKGLNVVVNTVPRWFHMRTSVSSCLCIPKRDQLFPQTLISAFLDLVGNQFCMGHTFASQVGR